MSIIPGTTPTLTLSLDRSITGCAAAEFCLACGTVRLLRPLSELSLSADGTEVSLRLTQTETTRSQKCSFGSCSAARSLQQTVFRSQQKNCYIERS